MNDSLEIYIAERCDEPSRISESRKVELLKLAHYIQSKRNVGQTANLTFICTHNSRRSHLAQIWAQVAAAHFGVDGIQSFSGGTEATAMNHRIVACLARTGFDVQKQDKSENPRYEVRFSADQKAITCFSKVYDSEPNPSSNFCAVMVCSDADEKCPLVSGKCTRLAITYIDPKIADETPQEDAAYDERCEQIAREMLYVFSQVTQK